MARTFEGRGYLLQGREFVAPVRYRLRSDRDGWGQSQAYGELWAVSTHWAGTAGESFVLQTEDGFSLPLALTGESGKQGQPFRRLSHQEVADGMG